MNLFHRSDQSQDIPVSIKWVSNLGDEGNKRN